MKKLNESSFSNVLMPLDRSSYALPLLSFLSMCTRRIAKDQALVILFTPTFWLLTPVSALGEPAVCSFSLYLRLLFLWNLAIPVLIQVEADCENLTDLSLYQPRDLHELSHSGEF